MEADTIETSVSGTRKPAAAPASPPDIIEEVPFRPFRIFRWRLLLTLFVFLVGTMLGEANSEHASDPGYFVFVGLVGTSVMALVLVGRRFGIKRKGGIPPLRFFKDRVEVPINAYSRKLRTFPYDQILSAAIIGTGRRSRIIFDTQKRAFSYPLREFADAGAAAQAQDILRRRIQALPDGATRWPQVEKRQTVAGLFAKFTPLATRAFTAAVCAVFLLQCLNPQRDAFTYLDMGANAPALVLKGEWYRLVTANLLHAGMLHLYPNVIFCYIIGALVERQMGTRRFALLVLVTGILCECASAAWTQYGTSGHLYSVGVSGVLFSMLGAQAVLNKRFGKQLPGGYRFTPRLWWTLLLGAFAVVPAMSPQVDIACHLGGFIAGIVVGWMLCMGQEDIAAPPPFTAGASLTLALVTALWVASIAQAVANLMNPAVLEADHVALGNVLAHVPKPNPVIDNEFSWALAETPQPSKEALKTALKLATIAVDSVAYAQHVSLFNAFSDTLATVHYRMGDLKEAIEIEEPLAAHGYIYASQLGRFLDAYAQAHGVRIVSDQTPPPVLTLKAATPAGDRPFDVTLSQPEPRGAQIYAVLKQDGHILALVDVAVWPGVTHGTGTLYAAELAHAGLKNSPEPVLVPVELDNTACQCGHQQDISSKLTPYNSYVASLP